MSLTFNEVTRGFYISKLQNHIQISIIVFFTNQNISLKIVNFTHSFIALRMYFNTKQLFIPKVMCIFAHPADPITDCGGALALHHDNGDEVYSLVLTHGGRKHPNQEFIHFDTKEVLFICGGAFDGMDKVIQRRMGEKVIGFNSQIVDTKADEKDILKKIQPEDLLKFGLIPEFIGRLPVIVTLEELSKEALVRIITEPKNAILKQYKKMFELDDVELEVEDEALERIAEKAIERKTGARGLRGILETAMTDIMYEIPSWDDVQKCIVSKEVIDGEAEPRLILEGESEDGEDETA
jgi:hypothetical protein